MNLRRFLVWMAVLALAVVFFPSADATDSENEITGEWQQRYDSEGIGFIGGYDCYPFMTVLADGTVKMTEYLYGKEFYYEGTWRFEKGFYFFRFNDYEEIKFTLKNGVLKSVNYRAWYPMIFTKPYSKGELTLGVPVDKYHFPDARFRVTLIKMLTAEDSPNIDEDDRYEAPQKKVQKIRELDLSGMEITSLKGIEYLTNLTKLNCDNNLLTELDLSGLTNLTELSCANNQLTEVRLDGCKRLKKLNCADNAISSLDLGGCASLTSLNCKGNRLTELDLSGLSGLKELDCGDNLLKALDPDACKNLEIIQAYGNRLVTLNLEKNTRLKKLDAHGNSRMLEARVGKNSSLGWIDLSGTIIKKLDLTGCGKFRQLAVRIPGTDLYQVVRKDKSGNTVLYTENSVTVLISDKITAGWVNASDKPVIRFQGLDWGISQTAFLSKVKNKKGWENGGPGSGLQLSSSIYGVQEIPLLNTDVTIYALGTVNGLPVENYGYKSNDVTAYFVYRPADGKLTGSEEDTALYQGIYLITLNKDTASAAADLTWKLSSLYGRADLFSGPVSDSESDSISTFTNWYGGENTVLGLETFDGGETHLIFLRFATLDADQWMTEADKAVR